MTNYMDNYLNWLESTTPEERMGRGRHSPGGSMTDVTGGEEPWLIHGARWPYPHAHQDLDRSQAGDPQHD
jgi:hypothetical protein